MELCSRLSPPKILAYFLVMVGMLTIAQYTWNWDFYSTKNIHHHWNRLLKQITGFHDDDTLGTKSTSHVSNSSYTDNYTAIVRNSTVSYIARFKSSTVTVNSQSLFTRHSIPSGNYTPGNPTTTTTTPNPTPTPSHHTTNTNITNINSSPVPTSSPLPRCPIVPPGLLGRQKVNTSIPPTWEEVERNLPQVAVGGRWRPTNCTANQTVAIVIPYRDREENLRVFLRHMHPFLQRQQLHYGIYVVEQNGEKRFNRAMLLNIGFLEAQKTFPYECNIQHDVDLLPEDDHNSYRCGKKARHMTVAIDYNDYKLLYKGAFGGVTSHRVEDFRKVNGYSNLYFGWGMEDDDMLWRVIRGARMQIERPPESIARYTGLQHKKAKESREKNKLYDQRASRHKWDGLNSLTYQVLETVLYPLYTLIRVHINRTEIIEIHHKIMAKHNITPSI